MLPYWTQMCLLLHFVCLRRKGAASGPASFNFDFDFCMCETVARDAHAGLPRRGRGHGKHLLSMGTDHGHEIPFRRVGQITSTVCSRSLRHQCFRMMYFRNEVMVRPARQWRAQNTYSPCMLHITESSRSMYRKTR